MKTSRITALLIIIITLVLAACTPAAEETTAPTDEPAAATDAPSPTDEPTDEPEPTAAPTEESFSVTVTDGMGTEVTLESRPENIVSMTLGTDEILLDLIGPDRLAAITYLAADETTSNIATRPELAQIPNTLEPNPSPEQIIALEPDLIFVASFTDAAVIQQLRDAGLPVFVVGFFNSIESMQENLLTIGDLVGAPEQAQAMVDEMNNRLTVISDALAGAESEPPSVLYLASGGWVAGGGTTTDDIITSAGGLNAAADLVDWNQVSEEAIIEMNPDWIILSPYVTDDEFVNNPVYAEMAAVQNGQAIPISDAYMSATSHYIVRGVEVLAHILYPDLVPVPEYLTTGG